METALYEIKVAIIVLSSLMGVMCIVFALMAWALHRITEWMKEVGKSVDEVAKAWEVVKLYLRHNEVYTLKGVLLLAKARRRELHSEESEYKDLTALIKHCESVLELIQDEY